MTEFDQNRESLRWNLKDVQIFLSEYASQPGQPFTPESEMPVLQHTNDVAKFFREIGKQTTHVGGRETPGLYLSQTFETEQGVPQGDLIIQGHFFTEGKNQNPQAEPSHIEYSRLMRPPRPSFGHLYLTAVVGPKGAETYTKAVYELIASESGEQFGFIKKATGVRSSPKNFDDYDWTWVDSEEELQGLSDIVKGALEAERQGGFDEAA